MLTEEQITLIEKSWTMVIPIQHLAAGIFYNKLFALDPSLREQFPENIDQQKRKLMATLNIAVNGLRDIQRLIPVLQKLAIRHVGYGVVNEHFLTVGEALLFTLQTGLQEAYTPDVNDAWVALFVVVSEIMINAMDRKREVLALL